MVAAQQLGFESVGIDLNPVAGLVASSATAIASPQQVKLAVARVMNRVEAVQGAECWRPEESASWFDERTLDELSGLWSLIQGESNKDLAAVLQVCFSATLRTVCSQRNHWGWICDNVRPSSLVYRDAISEFGRRTTQFINALFDADLERPLATLIESDALTALQAIPDNSIGAVVTSPPYNGMTDYVRSQRLTLQWLDLDLAIKKAEIGARFKRHRKNREGEFLSELSEVFQELQRVLSKSAYLCMVMGESKTRPGSVEALLADLVARKWSTVYRSTRWLPVQRSLSSASSEEEIVVLQNG